MSANACVYESMYFEIMSPVLKEYFKTFHWWVMTVWDFQGGGNFGGGILGYVTMQYFKWLPVLPKSLLPTFLLNISAVVTLKIFITASNNAWCHNPEDTWYFILLVYILQPVKQPSLWRCSCWMQVSRTYLSHYFKLLW